MSHSDEERLPSLQRSSSPVSDMNHGKPSRHDHVDSSSIASPPSRDRTGSVPGTGSRAGSGAESRTGSGAESRTGAESRAGSGAESRTGSGAESRTGSRTGLRAGSETGSRVGSGTRSVTGSVTGTGSVTRSVTRSVTGSRAGSVVETETESESERLSDGVVLTGRGSKGRYSTVGASETIGNRSSGESLSRDSHHSNRDRDRDSNGGVEYGPRGVSSDVPYDYGKHVSERQQREVEGEGEEDDEEGDEGDDAKNDVSLSHNVTEGHSGLYKGSETSRWFGRGGGVRGQVDGTTKISINFNDRYRGPPRSNMDADSRVDLRAKGDFGVSRRDEKDAFNNSLRNENSERDRGSNEDENENEDEIEDSDSYNSSSRSVAMHSCTDSDGASTGSERIYRPDTRVISRSRTGSDVSTGDEGNKSLGVQSRECKVKPSGDRRKDFKDDRSHSEHSDSELPPPDRLSPSMLRRSAAGSRRCVIYDEVKLNEGMGASKTSDVRSPPHSQPKSRTRTQSLNRSMDRNDTRITEMARKRMLEKEYEQKKERAIGKDEEEREMAIVNKQRDREREERRERERAMEKDDGREIAREEDLKRSWDRRRQTIEIRDSGSEPNGRNDPSHRQSVHTSVYGSADSEDEDGEEEGLGNSVESVTSYEEYRSTRPNFITEKVRDSKHPGVGTGTGTGAGHYNHLWVTAEDHERHVRALSDQLKRADEAAIQSQLERQEDMKRMEDNMLEDKVRYTEGQRRAEEEKENLLEEFNIEKEKSKAFQALLGAHSRGHALGSLLEGGAQDKARERERGASWDTALFTDSTRSTERLGLGAGASTDYNILREAFEAQLLVLESKIIKRDESLKLLELDCKTKGALLVTLSERVKEGEDFFNARADSGKVQELALEQQKGKNRALLDRVDQEEGRYAILEGHRDQDLELFRAEKNDLKAQLSNMMREMNRLRGDALDKERDSNARWEEAEGRVQEAVKDRKEVVKRHEKSVKALTEEHRTKELKVRLTPAPACPLMQSQLLIIHCTLSCIVT